MKRFLLALFFLGLVSGAFAYQIDFYGRDTCGLCNNLKYYLDGAGIDYIYHDIDSDDGTIGTEMFAWARKSDWYEGGSVTLPIVVVNETTVLESPSLSEVEAHLDDEAAVDDTDSCDDGSCSSGWVQVETDDTYPAIMIFGKDSSSGTYRLKHALDNKDQEYTFYDIEIAANEDSMWEWLGLTDFSGSYPELPVVVINGTTVLEHPSTSKVMNALDD